MELENIVANTVYLKAREGKVLYIFDFTKDRDVTGNALPPVLVWINKYSTVTTDRLNQVLGLRFWLIPWLECW